MSETKELKEIPFREGYYLDKKGNCYSAWVNKGRAGMFIGDKLKLLKGSKIKSGYMKINFTRSEHEYLHRLMLMTFDRMPSCKEMALHKNDDKTNNAIENLYWGTCKDNMRDRIINGISNKGERHGMSVLSDEDVMDIIKLKCVFTKKELAFMYKVHWNTIYKIHKNETWTHIGR